MTAIPDMNAILKLVEERAEIRRQEAEIIVHNRTILNNVNNVANGPWIDPASPLQPDTCTTMIELEILHSNLLPIEFLLPANSFIHWQASVLAIAAPTAAVALTLSERELALSALEEFIDEFPCALSFAHRVPEHDPNYLALSTIHNQQLANNPRPLPSISGTNFIEIQKLLQQYRVYYSNSGRRSFLSFFTDVQLSGILVNIPFEYFRDYRQKNRSQISEDFF